MYHFATGEEGTAERSKRRAADRRAFGMMWGWMTVAAKSRRSGTLPLKRCRRSREGSGLRSLNAPRYTKMQRLQHGADTYHWKGHRLAPSSPLSPSPARP